MDHLRRFTQVLGMVLGNGYVSVLFSGSVYKGALKGFCVPFLNCYACPMAVFSCPIGTLQHFMSIRAIPLMLLGIIGMIGISVGRMACGWLCPFGLIQDLLYKIPSRKLSIPQQLLKFKYLVLVGLVIVIPFITGVPWFSKLCPYGTLTAGIPWVLADPVNQETGTHVIDHSGLGFLFAVKIMILAVFLVLFVMAKRPFCRTVCPMGAILALFNRYSAVQISVAGGCTDCGACKAKCPMDIKISDNPCSTECIRCLNCTSCSNVSVKINSVLEGLKPAIRIEENSNE